MRLYKKDNNGRIRVWDIHAEGNVIHMVWGLEGGAMQTKTEVVKTNLSGRGLDEQTQLQIDARIKKQKDKGYVESRDKAIKQKFMSNALGYPQPMLAKPYADIKTQEEGYWAQHKYDGMRCLVTNVGGNLVAYSRTGQLITTIDHILKGMKVPEGMVLDGELYCHNTKLQTIMSYAAALQPGTALLKYVVYDCIEDQPHPTRLKLIKNNCRLGIEAYLAPTWWLKDEVSTALRNSQSKGYEGLILRSSFQPYESGKRSTGLIKVKSVLDDEFIIEDIVQSKDGWAILECEGGFSVTAPGSFEHKRHVWDHRDKYIGRKVRVEFANHTKDGKPFHPVATNMVTAQS